jgi:hypothetical protein
MPVQGLSKMLVNFSVVISPYKDKIIHQYIFVGSFRGTAQKRSPDLNLLDFHLSCSQLELKINMFHNYALFIPVKPFASAPIHSKGCSTP